LHYFYVKLDLYLHTTREKEEEETREKKSIKSSIARVFFK